MDFIQKRKIFYGISGMIMMISLLSFLIWGFNFGIDFTGGSLWELTMEKDINQSIEEISDYLAEQGLGQINIQTTGENSIILRFSNIPEGKHIELLKDIEEINPLIKEKRFESIGPSIGGELKVKSVWATILVFTGILLYLWYAFHHFSSAIPSYRYGVLAVLMLMHDALFIVGLFAVLGKFQGWEVNSDFLVALLVVIGYSVHDTIVVFDKIRENLKTRTKEPLKDIINLSIQQTLMRSLNTSLTTIFPLLTLYFFGPFSIKILVTAMIGGVIIGTYSSVFLAAPLLYDWSKSKS